MKEFYVEYALEFWDKHAKEWRRMALLFNTPTATEDEAIFYNHYTKTQIIKRTIQESVYQVEQLKKGEPK